MPPWLLIHDAHVLPAMEASWLANAEPVADETSPIFSVLPVGAAEDDAVVP